MRHTTPAINPNKAWMATVNDQGREKGKRRRIEVVVIDPPRHSQGNGLTRRCVCWLEPYICWKARFQFKVEGMSDEEIRSLGPLYLVQLVYTQSRYFHCEVVEDKDGKLTVRWVWIGSDWSNTFEFFQLGADIGGGPAWTLHDDHWDSGPHPLVWRVKSDVNSRLRVARILSGRGPETTGFRLISVWGELHRQTWNKDRSALGPYVTEPLGSGPERPPDDVTFEYLEEFGERAWHYSADVWHIPLTEEGKRTDDPELFAGNSDEEVNVSKLTIEQTLPYRGWGDLPRRPTEMDKGHLRDSDRRRALQGTVFGRGPASLRPALESRDLEHAQEDGRFPVREGTDPGAHHPSDVLEEADGGGSWTWIADDLRT